MIDLIVVGGGVAGLMAAGTAASRGLSVVLLEKMEKPARKLRITGKGRCNLTNSRSLDDFLAKIPQGAEFVRCAIEQFDNEKVISFFESIGVPLTVERGGRVFPTSGKAWDVADGLVSWARSQGVEIRCGAEVLSIKKGFTVELANETLEARNVLITTGGVSYPATGSTGDGYQFAYDLGHTIVPLRPSLVPLDIDKVRQFTGLSLKNVGLRLVVDGVIADERFGDVEFTDRALGGAIVLQISRLAVDALIDKRRVVVELDLKPALSQTKLKNRINRELEQLQGANFKILLQKLTPSNLFPKISEQCRIKLSEPLSGFKIEDVERLTNTLKSLKFNILDYRPFTEAIITAGGVTLDEIEPLTMESKLMKNLYFAGEVLDIDADTGGFNIQIALSTAVAAAKSMKCK